MELFGSNIKKILIFSQNEAFLKFSEIKKSLIFGEMELFSSITKKFQETDPPPPQKKKKEKKNLIIQETRALKKLLTLQEMELFSPP